MREYVPDEGKLLVPVDFIKNEANEGLVRLMSGQDLNPFKKIEFESLPIFSNSTNAKRTTNK